MLDRSAGAHQRGAGCERSWFRSATGLNGVLVVVAIGILVSGCSCFRDAEPVGPEPLCVEIQSDPRLNWYRGKPHTVYARVFPLSGVESFAASKVSDLLADPPPFLPGVTGTPLSRDIYPEGNLKFEFTLAPNQTISSFGVVAGYFKPLGRSKLVVGAAPEGSCVVVPFGESGIDAPIEPVEEAP